MTKNEKLTYAQDEQYQLALRKNKLFKEWEAMSNPRSEVCKNALIAYEQSSKEYYEAGDRVYNIRKDLEDTV